MIKNKKTMVLAIIIGSVLLIGIEVGYAWFSVGLTGNGNDADPVEMTATSLGTIEYSGVTAFQNGEMYPGEMGITTFVVKKGSQSGTGTYEIDLASEVDSVFGSDIEISLYKTTSSANKVEVRDGTLVTSGDVAKVDELIVTGNPQLVYGPSVLTTNSKQILESVNFDTSTLADTTYYLVYHYKNNASDSQNEQMGHEFSGKVTVRLILGSDAYNLKVKYVYAYNENLDISTFYETQLNSGASYSVTSPSINYYTADRLSVSGTMNANKEEVVKYSPIHDANSNGIADELENHTLTILYKYSDDTTAATTYTASLAYNASYNIPSPSVDGANPDIATVIGTMGYEDRTITVTYEIEAEESNSILSSLYEQYKEGNTAGNDVMMAKDEAGNIRYIGANPDNYVKFNNEEWRIIGSFNVDDGNGNIENRIKLIRSESIGNYSWDSSRYVEYPWPDTPTPNVNYGYGVNQWGESTYVDTKGVTQVYSGADLMRELNTLYLNGQSGTCYNNNADATTTCNFTSNGLNHGGSDLIEDAVWHTGAIGDSLRSTKKSMNMWYDAERGSDTGKTCTNNVICDDTVTRTTTWTGSVGLMYPSDYGYATGGGNTYGRDACLNRAVLGWDTGSYATDCAYNSWLSDKNNAQWTITPVAFERDDRADAVLAIEAIGYVERTPACDASAVRPVVYLKANAVFKSGNGQKGTNAFVFELAN